MDFEVILQTKALCETVMEACDLFALSAHSINALSCALDFTPPINHLCSLFLVVLIALFPCGGAKVRSLEVVIASRVLSSVLFKSHLVGRQARLLELEWLTPVTHWRERSASRRLERLISFEARLEVHPVLSSIAKLVLLILWLVTDVTRNGHVLVVSCYNDEKIVSMQFLAVKLNHATVTMKSSYLHGFYRYVFDVASC